MSAAFMFMKYFWCVDTNMSWTAATYTHAVDAVQQANQMFSFSLWGFCNSTALKQRVNQSLQ